MRGLRACREGGPAQTERERESDFNAGALREGRAEESKEKQRDLARKWTETGKSCFLRAIRHSCFQINY